MSYTRSLMRVAVGIAIGILVLGLSLACVGQKYGGILRYGLSADPPDLDPHRNSGTASQTVKLAIYDGLLEYGEGATIQPALASSWETPDSKTYIFHLVTTNWQNGTPFTAKDVKYSLERIMDPKTGAYLNPDISHIQQIDILDDHTVKVILKDVYAPLLAALANPYCGMVSADWMAAGPNLGMDMMGCGAFRFVERQPNLRIVVTKNPSYYKPGLPYLDGITFTPMADQNARVNALETGDVDFIDFPPWETWARIEANPKLSLIRGPDGTMLFLFNTNKKPFDDPRVRQAFRYAIEPKPIMDAVFSGTGTPNNGPWIPENNPFYNPDLADYFSHDIAKAKALLAAAGYPNGFDCTVTVTSTYSMHWKAATIVQRQLLDIGVYMELELWDWAAFKERELAGNYTIAVDGGLSLPTPEPSSYALFFSPSSSYYAGPAKFFDAELEQLLAQGAATTDFAARKQIYHDYEKRLLDLSPAIWYMNREAGWACSKDVKGFVFLLTATSLWADTRALNFTWLDR